MVPLTHARRIVKRGETAESYFTPNLSVITTTTVADNELFCLPWEKELEIIQDFGPDYHIPADASVYEGQETGEREELVRQSLRGFLFFHDELTDNPGAFSDEPPVLIPLIKGISDYELDLCFRVLHSKKVQLAAFYATQYFTGGNHARHYELVDDLEHISEIMPPNLRLLTIGTLGLKLLAKFPDTVVAAAGQNQWRKRITPRKQTHEEMIRAYVPFAEDVNQTLDAAVPPSLSPLWSPKPTSD